MIMKMREMMKRKNGQKGFTLIELIVVMAILAVLAALAVPRYTGMLADAKEKADKANVQLLQRTVELYYSDTGSFPTSLDALSPKYMSAIPKQQAPAGSSGSPFTYVSTTASGTVTE